MEPTEIAAAFNDPLAQELLNCPIGHLAYSGLDDHPRVIPIGFFWNGKEIVVCTAPTSPKASALETNRNVAFSVDRLDPAPQMLSVRGTVTTELVHGVADEYLKASAKTMDEASLAQFEAEVRKVHREMVRVSIAPHWARVYDFGTGRIPQFLAQLVEDAQG